jgi:hypothetical protein
MDLTLDIDVVQGPAVRIAVLRVYLRSIKMLLREILWDRGRQHLGIYRWLPASIEESFGPFGDMDKAIPVAEIIPRLFRLIDQADSATDADRDLVRLWACFYGHVQLLLTYYIDMGDHVVPKQF